jgi:hypothetical protein
MEEETQKSWFSRNWGWVLGGGCLSLIIVVIIVIAGVFYKVSDAIQESEPYSHAFSQASTNKSVIAFLGEPIETNGMGTTNYNYINGTKTVSLSIPIKGPKDEGNIVVEAEKLNNEWAYYELYVKIDGETEIINLDNTIIEEKELDNF